MFTFLMPVECFNSSHRFSYFQLHPVFCNIKTTCLIAVNKSQCRAILCRSCYITETLEKNTYENTSTFRTGHHFCINIHFSLYTSWHRDCVSNRLIIELHNNQYTLVNFPTKYALCCPSVFFLITPQLSRRCSVKPRPCMLQGMPNAILLFDKSLCNLEGNKVRISLPVVSSN